MIADLIAAYTTYMVVGIVSCLTVVGAWNVFKDLAGASN